MALYKSFKTDDPVETRLSNFHSVDVKCRALSFLCEELLSFHVLVWLQQGGSFIQILCILVLILRQQHPNDSLLESEPPSKAVWLVSCWGGRGGGIQFEHSHLPNVLTGVKLWLSDLLICSLIISTYVVISIHSLFYMKRLYKHMHSMHERVFFAVFSESTVASCSECTLLPFVVDIVGQFQEHWLIIFSFPCANWNSRSIWANILFIIDFHLPVYLHYDFYQTD